MFKTISPGSIHWLLAGDEFNALHAVAEAQNPHGEEGEEEVAQRQE